MLTTLSVMKHQIGERTYHFLCAPDSPLQDVKEALFEFVKVAGKIEEEAKLRMEDRAKSEAQDAEKAPEEVSEVVAEENV